MKIFQVGGKMLDQFMKLVPILVGKPEMLVGVSLSKENGLHPIIMEIDYNGKSSPRQIHVFSKAEQHQLYLEERGGHTKKYPEIVDSSKLDSTILGMFEDQSSLAVLDTEDDFTREFRS